MRKITKEAWTAWSNRKPFKKANTRVDVDFNKERTLYLHGNCIAKEEYGDFLINNCDWITNTTKERLNMFPGIHIKKVKGDFILNGSLMPRGWIKIN